MADLTVEELFEALIESAGDSELGIAPVDTLDVPFTEIGYDSLALMETAARISQRTGIPVDDEELLVAETPRQMLDLFNRTMTPQA
jgi:minimal PKS acyl carrier protein